jgi:hypothetical protein
LNPRTWVPKASTLPPKLLWNDVSWYIPDRCRTFVKAVMLL